MLEEWGDTNDAGDNSEADVAEAAKFLTADISSWASAP